MNRQERSRRLQPLAPIRGLAGENIVVLGERSEQVRRVGSCRGEAHWSAAARAAANSAASMSDDRCT